MYTLKDFNDLTITDDFMFCKVMENTPLCKEFLKIVLTDSIKCIKTMVPQHTMSLSATAKSVRFDVLVQDEAGFRQAKDAEVRDFLEYLKRGRIPTDFMRRLERMVQAVRNNEQAQQEYQWVSGHIMDVRDSGFSQGVYQTKRETARLMKRHIPIL